MKITKAKYQTTNKGTDKETVKVLFVTESEDEVWISIPDFSASGCNPNVQSYVGGDITVEYYGVGETVGTTDIVVNTPNTIKRSWSLSANPIIEALASIELAKQAMLAAQIAQAKFAKRKAVSDAAALAAEAKPETVIS